MPICSRYYWPKTLFKKPQKLNKLWDSPLLIDLTVEMFKAAVCTEEEEEEKSGYRALSGRVTDMVETVKHAIVLLQIAKVQPVS